MHKQIISTDPEILSGTPVFAGTRVPVKNLFDYLQAGDTLDEFLDDFPSVTRENAIAALQLGREMIEANASVACRMRPSAIKGRSHAARCACSCRVGLFLKTQCAT